MITIGNVSKDIVEQYIKDQMKKSLEAKKITNNVNQILSKSSLH